MSHEIKKNQYHDGSAAVSIIVPVYKVEEYLARCVDSILKQTFGDFELILVDDGSPDACPDMCDAYGQKDSRVRVIHKPNGGLSDARNTGIDVANGNYIMFIDSDDWIHENTLEYLYEQMMATGAEISCCGFQRVYGEQDIVSSVGKAENTRVYSKKEALSQFFTDNHAQIVVAWGKLYARALFDTVRYPKGKLHEDEFTTYLLLYAANKTAVSDVPYFYYFQRDDSIIGSGFDINKRLHAVEAHIQRGDFLDEVGYGDLAAIAYRKAFLLSFNIEEKLQEAKSQQDVLNFRAGLSALKVKLRKQHYQLKFKLLYEAYYAFPSGVSFLHSAIKNR
ncbi:glycosyltransferase family 2 protein [Alteromonas halophila]|uniref:Glycosyl transferase n=1 Tax=Alteromonas halophila TaxID=516698 RepID=A0A918JM89_9ALTE|nr:glycosyltransferase family 2 protein [Alteromonas halophila]GGW86950.1 glycosyl transferase [Alteromonas halophila]